MNISLKQKLEESIRKAFSKNFPDIKFQGEILDAKQHRVFGDFASSLPLRLTSVLKKSPQDIALSIINSLEDLEEFEKPEFALPGFINFSFSKKFLTENLDNIKRQGVLYGKPVDAKLDAKLDAKPSFDKIIVSDISHPNIAKPMGIHHILSTVIGDCLNRLFVYAGYKIVRDNYLGDWGTQFGKLIYAYKTWGDPEIIKKNPIPELLKLYVKFHNEAEKHPELEEKGRISFKKLEQGDKENRKLWKWVCDISLAEFQKIYKLFGVKFDVIHGESFYEDKMKPIISLGIKKKVFVKGEKGALIVKFPNEKYPATVIQKSDGATLYITRDLARIKYWEETWHPDLMINVVDIAQKLYFEQLFETAKMLGLTDAFNLHIAFGRMKFPEKRMSTRKGNIVLLEEVIDEAIALARKIVEEKSGEKFKEKEKQTIAEKVGIGALKFAVLIQNRETDTTFTWEKILSLEGDSGPYLQYVYARARSILRKNQDFALQNQNARLDATPTSADKSKIYILQKPEEIELARFLPKFPEIIEETVAVYRPNILARYLCDLASKFNTFYNALPVLRAKESKAAETRLKLVEAVSIILKTGLELLGIEALERM